MICSGFFFFVGFKQPYLSQYYLTEFYLNFIILCKLTVYEVVLQCKNNHVSPFAAVLSACRRREGVMLCLCPLSSPL